MPIEIGEMICMVVFLLVLGLLLLVVDAICITRSVLICKMNRWEELPKIFRAISIISVCIVGIFFAAFFLSELERNSTAPLYFAFFKAVGGVWIFIVATAILLYVLWRKINNN